MINMTNQIKSLRRKIQDEQNKLYRESLERIRIDEEKIARELEEFDKKFPLLSEEDRLEKLFWGDY